MHILTGHHNWKKIMTLHSHQMFQRSQNTYTCIEVVESLMLLEDFLKEDYRLRDNRTNGKQIQWKVEPRKTDPMESRSNGKQIQWKTEPTENRTNGKQNQRKIEPTENRTNLSERFFSHLSSPLSLVILFQFLLTFSHNYGLSR
jgi:hypothetical protein